MTMILMDSETTGLNEISVAPLESQPHLIELVAWKVDPASLEVKGKLAFVCRPPIPIPEKVTHITGITNEMVAEHKRFAAYLPFLTDFFLGTKYWIAHNLPYDRQVLTWELMRLDRVTSFPWPPEQICTVERSQDILGHYTSLSALYAHYYGENPAQQHRGEGDVELLYKVVVKMREEGRL